MGNQPIIEFAMDKVSVSITGDQPQSLAFSLGSDCVGEAGAQDDKAAIAWLREQLGIKSSKKPVSAIVCIPRSVCCIHHFSVPTHRLDQVVGMAQLEVETLFGESADSYTWDLVATGTPREETQEVVVYIVETRYLERLNQILAAASVEPRAITLTEAMVASAHSGDAMNVCQTIVMRPDRVDLMTTYRNAVLQSQSLRYDAGDSCNFSELQGVMRRFDASLDEVLRTRPVQRTLMIDRACAQSNQSSTYRESLVASAREAAFDVVTAQLNVAPRQRGSSSEKTLNLAEPTRAKPPRFSSRTLIAAAASAMLIAGGAFYAWNTHQSRKLDDQIQLVKRESSELDRQLRGFAADLNAADEFARWQDSRVSWDGQLDTISQLFNETEDMYIVRLQMDSPRREDQPPSTRLEGRATTANRVLALTRDLADHDPGLSVQPNGIEPSSIDSEYKSQFRLFIAETGTKSNSASSNDKTENES